MYSNELNKEVTFHNRMLKCEHILSVRRALKRQLSLTLTVKGKNSPGRQGDTLCRANAYQARNDEMVCLSYNGSMNEAKVCF